MCGPSGAEVSEQHEMANFDNLLRNNYSLLFNKQVDTLQQIHDALSPIIAAGPDAHGMSAEELHARQAQAVSTSGAAAQQAEQAARLYSAGRGGGGTSGVMSGIDQQIQAGIASQGAQAEASRLGQITEADYALGREKFWRAEGGMQALAGQLSPNAAMGGSISGGEAAFSEAKTMSEQSNAMWKDIGSFVTAGIGAGADLFKAFKMPGAGKSSGGDV